MIRLQRAADVGEDDRRFVLDHLKGITGKGRGRKKIELSKAQRGGFIEKGKEDLAKTVARKRP